MKKRILSNKRELVALSLGSNMGDRKKNLAAALHLLADQPGISLKKVSSLYETSPVGGPRQRPFLNGVALLKVSLKPIELLFVLKLIEKTLGRKSGRRWGPRPIDLDILTFGGYIIRSNRLIIPHPRYHDRRFVLVPLVEISPHQIHPGLRKKNVTLLRDLTPDEQRVTIHSRWKKSRFLSFIRKKF